MIDTAKLDDAILEHLRTTNGVETANIGRWQILLQKVGSANPPDYDEVESAIIRLCAREIVYLRRYDDQRKGWDVIRANDVNTFDRDRFFRFGSFELRITDYGRTFWKVPHGPIGFQKPA
jgi:hypothetical protein